jgi:hypothetical protein
MAGGCQRGGWGGGGSVRSCVEEGERTGTRREGVREGVEGVGRRVVIG